MVYIQIYRRLNYFTSFSARTIYTSGSVAYRHIKTPALKEFTLSTLMSTTVDYSIVLSCFNYLV